MPERSSVTNEGAAARASRAALDNSGARNAVPPKQSSTPPSGGLRDMGRADLGSRMRFLHGVQRSAGNRALQRSTPTRSTDRHEAGERVVAPTPASAQLRRPPGAVDAVAANVDVQRAPGGAGAPSPAGAAAMATARNEIELLGSRLKINQINLTSFLRDANADIINIRAYFKWLNDVYARSYQHYALVIAQAGAEAQTEQAWLDFASGVAIGVTVGLISEAAIAGRAAEKALEGVTEVAAEFVEGGIGSFAKFAVPKPALTADLTPALKQVATLTKLDELNAAVLPAAISGSLYLDPIVQSERLTAELRVAEAGGARRMSDADVQDMRLKLMRFEVSSSQSDRVVTTAVAAFDALRKRYQGRQPPSDERTEQDIWIPWITAQSGAPQLNVFITPVLSRTVLANHLVDIGLAGRGAPGGRLNADISKSRRTKPDDILTTKEPHQQLILGARAEAPAIPPFWAKLLLSD